MKLSRQEVEHIAELAKLGLTGEEVERYQDQLSSILDYVEMLTKLDTEDARPMAHVLPVSNVMREDHVRASFPRDEILSNAPDTADGCFRVPLVLEESNS